MIPSTMLPNMEQRDITFDPVPHTYVDSFGNNYTSVTTVVGKVEEPFDAELWSMHRALDQIEGYRPYPDKKKRTITIWWNGKRQEFSLPFLYSGVIPTIKTPDQIRAEWQAITDESCDWGTERHEYLEDCINKFSKTTGVPFHDIKSKTNKGYAFKITNLEELENSPLKHAFPAIYQKIHEMVQAGWVCYAEKRVYSAYHLVAGTIDLLMVRGKDIFIIDWKTNKDKLKFTPGYYKKRWLPGRTKKVKTSEWVSTNEKLLYPLNHIPKCKGMMYTLQLSLYSAICEMWGFNPTGCVLCHIRPKLDEYKEPIIEVVDGERRRIELPPEFYKINYLREDAMTLLNWQLETFN